MIENITLVRDGADLGTLRFDDIEFGAGFPAMWGFCESDGKHGQAPQDAGTIHFTVIRRADEGEIYEDGVTVAVTLADLVEDVLDGIQDRPSGIIGAEHIADARRLAEALKAAAMMIEDRMPDAGGAP